MAKSQKSSASKIAVWVILVLLVAGLAGFGAGGLGGNITKIGEVGQTPITVQEYQRALQQELNFETRRRGDAVSIQQAIQEGIDLRVRTRLAANAALAEEARMMGLSVGDAEVIRELRQVPAFQGASGTFNRDTYEFTLQQSGLRPNEFEENIRRTAAVGLLQQAVTGGLVLDDAYADTLYNFLGERRSFRWASVTPDLLVVPNPQPADAQLQAYYDDNSAQFETPQLRKISYIWLTPDMLTDTIEPTDGELQALYEERSDEYNQPERRLVERLSFLTMDAAQDAKAAIEAGETSFETLVEERGLTLEDVDQGEVARDDLDAPIADVVFAVTEPGLSEPVETSLGPAIYRINAVLEARETPFEDVREELAAEAAADQARRAVQSFRDDIDDLLVGGATLEEVADETPAQFGTVDYSGNDREGITGYDNFRDEAERLQEGDFPEVADLSDGGLFAARLDEIVPPTLPALDEIRDEVATAWDAAEINRRLAELGETLKAQLDAGTQLESLGLEGRTETDRTRTDFIEGAPIGLLIEAFDLPANGTALVEDESGVILLELLDISPPDTAADEAQAVISQLSAQGSQGLAADVFEMFGQAIQSRHGLSLDQAALNAVHAQMGGGVGGI
ncbi:peptidyl-prolyl cis-trans isomerase D [Litoreibacter ponti]|uniref:Parvulin-like PPIase n=1 Tax=Litoreibacter ponti TaxID=1510457 RepID=A0A2T6BIP8_9RHOB|nr:peptidyl-prolyl cis-trans isomerase [Litoreibacter ponti]PTX55926.1 peptidyl-prolyl cis-trans isomerase D [Litoreibacter ponti]